MPVAPDGWPPNLLVVAKTFRRAATRLEENAAEVRGHLLGMRAPCATRVRDELSRMHDEAQADAERLRTMAAYLERRSETLEDEQQAYYRARH